MPFRAGDHSFCKLAAAACLLSWRRVGIHDDVLPCWLRRLDALHLGAEVVERLCKPGADVKKATNLHSRDGACTGVDLLAVQFAQRHTTVPADGLPSMPSLVFALVSQ